MTILDLIRLRRSVRNYRPDMVPREMINRCLEAARLAPSACNSQPWSFIVADREPVRTRLAQAAFSGIYAMNNFAARAPVLVVVVTGRSKFIAALAGRFRGVHYNLIDVGIVCGYLSLAAEEQGLGVCMLGWFDEEAVKRVLELPRQSRIDMMLSMGYPADVANMEKARKLPGETWRYAGEKSE